MDGVAYTPQVRNNRRIVTLPDGNAQAAVVYRYNANGAPIGMYVWTLEYRNNAYVATEQPGLTDLLTYHDFPSGLPEKRESALRPVSVRTSEHNCWEMV